MSLDPAARARIFEALSAAEGQVLGLAVSGGGDSMALTALAAEWSKAAGRALAAITIDHALRSESAGEAQRVAAFCRELGIGHDTLVWDGWDGTGNLQDMARRARMSLIADWAGEREIRAVATGHTQDDQAETLLMRLARGSGVDGLSAMAPVRRSGALTWVRPLLQVSRADLRDFLAAEGLPWIDDPSNEDPRFDRVRARRALAALAELGIEREGLAATADRMRRARVALELATAQLARQAARIDRGDVLIDWPLVARAPEEIRNRLVAAVLQWVSGVAYRPRASALDEVIAAMNAGRTAVLSGCLSSTEGSHRRLARELAAVRDCVAPLGSVWDGRWRVSGPRGARGEVRALGDTGIRACPDWREAGLPRTSLVSSPAVWEGSRLIAAPLAGFGWGWSAALIEPRSSLADAIIAH